MGMADPDPELLRRIEELMEHSRRHQRDLARITDEIQSLREKIAHSRDLNPATEKRRDEFER